MNRIFTLFFGLLILSLQACTNNQTNSQPQYPTRTKTDLEKMGLHGKVKSLNIKSYSLDPKTGKTKETFDFGSLINSMHLDEFTDVSRYLTPEVTFSGEEILYFFKEYQFNNLGNINKSIYENADGEGVFEYTHDKLGRVSSIRGTDHTFEYNYNEEGHLYSVTLDNDIFVIKSLYDDKNRISEMKLTYPSQTLYLTSQYTYFDEGYDVTIKFSGEYNSESLIRKEYDSKNTIKSISHYDKKDKVKVIFNSNALISKIDKNGKKIAEFNYTLDSKGNWIKRIIKRERESHIVTERKISYY